MNTMTDTRHDELLSRSPEASASAVAWAAIIGGTLAAAAISLILLILGSALGLSTVSPWSSQTVTGFTVKTAIWLVVMQWFASGVGGYLTGRLRTKWVGMHSEEVFFRDTAHGFLAWAAATLLTASVLASTVSSILGGGVQATATVASGSVAQGEKKNAESNLTDPTGYYIDSLFRSTTATPNTNTPDVRAETMRILVLDIKNGTVPDADKTYLAQLISARTGLNYNDVAMRVEKVIGELNADKEKAKEDAEAARKTAMHVALYIAFSMLIGAFIASAAAAIGGRRRDEY